MRRHQLAYVTALSVIVIVCMLSGNYKKDVASSIDNRYLTKFPQEISEDLTEQLSDFVQDRIGFRDQMIWLYTNFNNKIFRIFPNGIYGADDNLFGTGDDVMRSYQHLDGDAEYAEYFAEFLDKLQNYCMAKGIEFVYMLNPNKATTYPEWMPASVGVYDAENLTGQIKDKVDERGIRHVFVDEIFNERKGEELLFYKRYDIAHWSDYGRIIGVNAVLEELTEEPLSVEEDYVRKEAVAVKQLVSAITINDALINYMPKAVYLKQETDSIDTLQLVNPDSFGVYKNKHVESAKKKRLLLLCDSYLLGYFDYFGDNFSEIICIHAYDASRLQMMIDLFEPDTVLFENVERAMNAFYPKDLVRNYDNAMIPAYEKFCYLPEQQKEGVFEITKINETEVKNECRGSADAGFWTIEGIALQEDYTAGTMVYMKSGEKIYTPMYYDNGAFKFVADEKTLHSNETIEFLLVDAMQAMSYQSRCFEVVYK